MPAPTNQAELDERGLFTAHDAVARLYALNAYLAAEFERVQGELSACAIRLAQEIGTPKLENDDDAVEAHLLFLEGGLTVEELRDRVELDAGGDE